MDERQKIRHHRTSADPDATPLPPKKKKKYHENVGFSSPDPLKSHSYHPIIQ